MGSSQLVGSATQAYFYVVENWSTTCSNNVMYIDLSNPAGRAMYATLLSVQATGKPIYRVHYSTVGTGASTTCTADLVEVR